MGELRKDRRRYLTQDELARLIGAARKGRYGQRDATLILMMARHGLRVSEAIDLEWDQIDFTRAHLHVRRLKGGIASVHPFQGESSLEVRNDGTAADDGAVVPKHRSWESDVTTVTTLLGRGSLRPTSRPPIKSTKL